MRIKALNLQTILAFSHITSTVNISGSKNKQTYFLKIDGRSTPFRSHIRGGRFPEYFSLFGSLFPTWRGEGRERTGEGRKSEDMRV